jgi:predicted RecB family nuclease
MPTIEHPFEDYLSCKRKLLLRSQGAPQSDSEYTRFLEKSKERLDARVSGFLRNQSEAPVSANDANTRAWLLAGHPLLLNLTINERNLAVRIDAAKRKSGKSALGDFFYSPMLFHPNETLRSKDRLLLALHGLMLGSLQHHLPPTGTAILGDSLRFSTVQIESQYSRAREIMRDAIDIVAGHSEPPLILNDHCRLCIFQDFCMDQALREGNLSLLDRMGERDITHYNSKGIFTLHQLSFTFRPRRKSKRAKRQSPLHNHALQALALREKRPYVLMRPMLPMAPRRVYIDMEGDEQGRSIYLIGILFETDWDWEYRADLTAS